MPFTLSHPAAVIPLRRFFAEPLAGVALVIGSMSPDFGYYVHWFGGATYAHTLGGTLALCLPSSWLVLGALLFFRKSWFFLMPSRHREVLTDGLFCPVPRSYRGWMALCAAIWIGALTHVFWDSFTHQTGWFVRHFQALQGFPSPSLPGYHLLQQISTLGGGVILAVAYLRRLALRSVDSAAGTSDRRRWIFWIAMAAVSLSLGSIPGGAAAVGFHGLTMVRVFLFRTAVAAGGIFAGLAFLCLLGVHFCRAKEVGGFVERCRRV